jgi:hypothetical protein
MYLINKAYNDHYFFFGGGVWTQVLTLDRQVLYSLSHSTSPALMMNLGLGMLGKHSATELQPQPVIIVLFLECSVYLLLSAVVGMGQLT